MDAAPLGRDRRGLQRQNTAAVTAVVPKPKPAPLALHACRQRASARVGRKDMRVSPAKPQLVDGRKPNN